MRITYSYRGKETEFVTEKDQVIMGRPKEGLSIDLDLSVDRSVSRPHARLWVEGGEYWIEDLNSKRGTQVGGKEIWGAGKRHLEPGEMFRIGDIQLRLNLPRLVSDPRDTVPPLLSTSEPLDGMAAPPGVEFEGTLDASKTAFIAIEPDAIRAIARMAVLYELPLQFGAGMPMSTLLDMIVERLVQVIPGAVRGALVLRDRSTDALLLKSYIAADSPAVSETLARRAMTEGRGFIWRRRDEGDVGNSILRYNIETGMYAPLVWQGAALGAVCVDNPHGDAAFHEDDLRLMIAIAQYAAMAVANQQLQDDLRQNTHLLQRLLTNFSPKIRETLLEKARRGRLRPGGEKSEVTILCSDIRGFTRICADLDAEDIVEMLNLYFSAQIDVIFRYDETIDKFVGDSILAVFGSPEPDPLQHIKAVQAAHAMQAAITQLNVQREGRGDLTCEIGIGVHCGQVMHGFIGSADRIEFTVIGDAVNRTSRYCGAAIPGQVLISPEVYQHVYGVVDAESTTIGTKHEGDTRAYRLKAVRA